MKMVVGVQGSEEGSIVDNAAEIVPSGGSAPSKKVPDPVVYKLVRVDFDGRFVPATDDELMEVENLFELEKSEVFSFPDIVETVGQGLDEDDMSEKHVLKKFKGSPQNSNAEVDEEKMKDRHEIQENFATCTSGLNNKPVNQSGNTKEESSSLDALNKAGSAGSKPDFSRLKGEINLDILTIRELQETFRATFGRETNAKDKMWLKRRIAMGLTNSCDVSVSSFVIKNGQFLKSEESNESMGYENTLAGEVCDAEDDMPVAGQNLMEDTAADVVLRNSLMESGHGSDDALGQNGLKRMRKPTKRYIEELSDKKTRDCSGKLMPSAKRFEHHKPSLRLPVRTAWGIQVPYVSRVRRCRPRKSVMALTKFHQSEIPMMDCAESSVAVNKPDPDGLGGDKDVEAKSISSRELLASEEKEQQCLTGTSDISLDREPTETDSPCDAPEDNSAGGHSDNNMTTAKGGMRRKHHRAWTLTEVVKLVDGVSKFGAGRWSEIKRLSFSSYSHRTSVDLKDKWRNLLKASYTNPPTERGMNPRKNVPSPIPAPILVKVRELAEINGQAPPLVKASNENNRPSVNEIRSGYL